jgi:hypothetical protein
MNRTITFQADDKLERSIDEECELSGENRDELIKELLRRQLFVRAFERARAELAPTGKARGYLTEEDVFRDNP